MTAQLGNGIKHTSQHGCFGAFTESCKSISSTNDNTEKKVEVHYHWMFEMLELSSFHSFLLFAASKTSHTDRYRRPRPAS